VLRPRSVLYDEGVDGEGTRDLVDLDIDTFHGLSSAPASTAAGCRARLAWADADGCAASYRSFWLHELAHRVKLRCCKVVSSDTQPGCDRLPPSLPPHQHSSSAMSCLARRRVLRDAPGREEAVSYRLPDGETVELAVPVTHGLQVRNPGDARAAHAPCCATFKMRGRRRRTCSLPTASPSRAGQRRPPAHPVPLPASPRPGMPPAPRHPPPRLQVARRQAPRHLQNRPLRQLGRRRWLAVRRDLVSWPSQAHSTRALKGEQCD
jgi:hypothetical protein